MAESRQVGHVLFCIEESVGLKDSSQWIDPIEDSFVVGLKLRHTVRRISVVPTKKIDLPSEPHHEVSMQTSKSSISY